MRGSKARILEFLRSHDGITSMGAYRYLGITRLSARIQELRKLGYRIKTVIVNGTNRFDEPVRYAVYVLEEDNNE